MDGRILIVDDDAAVRATFERTLSGEGLTLDTVSDAFHALQLLGKHECALLDPMPEIYNGSSNRADTILDTPGSSIVTP